MIIANLKGGLGNQMFQYAAGRCLAHLRGAALKLDDAFLQADPGGAYTKRHFELDVFEMPFQIANASELVPFYRIGHNRYLRNIEKRLPFLFAHHFYSERDLSFHKDFHALPGQTYLDGYFQSEQYFDPVASIIRKDFTFKGPVPKACEDWLREIRSTESVSLHIRRGDYVSNPSNTTYYASCSESYYRRAVDELLKQHRNIGLFVFSDDLDWCRKNLAFNDLPVYFVDANTQAANHWDMFLMSQCRHNIMANSSFSWWAAWLNGNASKTVIAPAKWFGNDTKQAHDIIPLTWKKI